MPDESAAPRRRRWWLIGLATVAVFVVSVLVLEVSQFGITQSIGRVTEVTDPDGFKRTVHWREYPGIAGIDSRDVLDGPTLEEGYAGGTAMVADIEGALTAEFGMGWTNDRAGEAGFDPFHRRVQNWFGGESMLTLINAPSSVSTTGPTSWTDKQRATEIIAEVTARHGYSAPVLGGGGPQNATDEDLVRDFGGTTPETQVIVSGNVAGPTGQWLSFAFMDLTKDVDGRFAERLGSAVDSTTGPSWITLSYGANGLLPEADREEFERRLEPFAELTQPPPLET